MRLLLAFFLAASLGSAFGFCHGACRSVLRSKSSAESCIFSLPSLPRETALLSQDAGQADLDPETKDMIDMLVGGNKVLLFMKGNKLFPQCGFSNTAVRILDAIGTDFETCDVLENDRIRNGVKLFSSWPTIPQLYVAGEFVGGTDIMIEMYENGELAEMIELANAS